MRQAKPVRLSAMVEVVPGQRLPAKAQFQRSVGLWTKELPRDRRTSIQLMVLAELPEKWQPNLVGFLTRLGQVLPVRLFSRVTASVDVRRERQQPRFIVDIYWVEVEDDAGS